MVFGRVKTRMIETNEALPGRSQPVLLAPKNHTVLGTPIAGPVPDGFAEIYFGLGCFWGAERKFWQVPGVYTTAVGYEGGYTPNPTYDEVCTGRTAHTEAVRVVYDPAKVSLEDLLKVFWTIHDPTQGYRQANDVGTQYRSAVYWTTPEQRDVILATKATYQAAIDAVGLRRHHHGRRARGGAPVLLRRGLPPAVPLQEPARLRLPLEHRGPLPGGLTARLEEILLLAVGSGCRRSWSRKRGGRRVRS